jgi:hypothetical protein
MGDGGNVMMSKSMKGETVEQQREREAAEAAFQERKNKVKKRREVREKQLQKVLNEKQAVEEELEELRKSAATWGSQLEGESAEAAAFDKKLNKLKKKYEKRIQTLKQENDDIRDEFNYQRQQLQDALTEQDKDLKLYEQICQALLADKDLKKIVERAKWDEDEDCWVLPYVKRRSLDTNHSNGGGSKLLPDINSGQNSKQAMLGSNDMEYLNGSLSARDPSPVDRGMVVNGLGVKGVGISKTGSPGIGQSSNSRPSSSANAAGRDQGLIPMLMLPSGGSAQAQYGGGEGIAGAQEKKKKKKKKKVKQVIDKVRKRQMLDNVCLLVISIFCFAVDGQLPDMQTDEAGCGESAGAISDWGFASLDAPVGNGMEEPEQEYSDDEDFETDDTPTAGGNNNNNMHVPPIKNGAHPPANNNAAAANKPKPPSQSSLPPVKLSPRGV